MMQSGRMGVYFHWPFCLSKCPYCDFNTHVRGEIDYPRWLEAYLTSLEFYAQKMPQRIVSSVFFGGGTPSLMRPEDVALILEKVRELWPQVNDLEVTLEANPTSVEAEKFKEFAGAGVTRVSIGVQALNDADLQFLGRKHSAAEALKAIETAGDVFERFSFDLIYARPEQTLEAWRDELERAGALCRSRAGGHLSLYQLTIERNTPFHFDYAQGHFSVPKEDVAADFYDLTQGILSAAGLPAYEVSNHAMEGDESRHNLNYWRYGDYIGIGPGAHGRLTLGDESGNDGRKYATREHQAPDIWLSRVEARGSGAHPFKPLNARDRFMESLMMGLRVYEGLPFARLEQEGAAPWAKFIDAERLDILSAQGWLSYDEERLRLSVQGMLRLNSILPYILKDKEEGQEEKMRPRAVRP